jgi:hypothetical protein
MLVGSEIRARVYPTVSEEKSIHDDGLVSEKKKDGDMLDKP